MTAGQNYQLRKAIVVGSDSGIGRATAVALAATGADVGVTWHTDEDGTEGTAAQVRRLGRRAEVTHLDTTDFEQCGGAVTDLIERLDGVDAFVQVSGTGSTTLALEMSFAEWRKVVATDLDGGEIATAMTGQEDEDPRGTRRPGIPLGRPGDANEVAAVIAFLAGERSAYVTGASWVVDGGMLQMGPVGAAHVPDDGWRRT